MVQNSSQVIKTLAAPLNSSFTTTSSLCVGGASPSDLCSGSFYQRTFGPDLTDKIATSATANTVSPFTNFSANEFDLTLSSSGGVNGLGNFGSDVLLSNRFLPNAIPEPSNLFLAGMPILAVWCWKRGYDLRQRDLPGDQRHNSL